MSDKNINDKMGTSRLKKTVVRTNVFLCCCSPVNFTKNKHSHKTPVSDEITTADFQPKSNQIAKRFRTPKTLTIRLEGIEVSTT